MRDYLSFLGHDRRIQRAYEGTVVEYNKRRGRREV
jgi:hypothetical protein